jgi:flagellar protein FlgJ
MQVPPTSHVSHAAATHDLAALKRGNLDPAEQRAAVAGQFEAILLRQFLQNSIGSMLGSSGGGGPGAGGGGSVYGYMLTDTLADKLSQGRGMGLASMIAKQLTPRGAIADADNPGDTEP